jgi:hypothetical protein
MPRHYGFAIAYAVFTPPVYLNNNARGMPEDLQFYVININRLFNAMHCGFPNNSMKEKAFNNGDLTIDAWNINSHTLVCFTIQKEFYG